jgi:tetratricopeptide (TPR) repeat protein
MLGKMNIRPAGWEHRESINDKARQRIAAAEAKRWFDIAYQEDTHAAWRRVLRLTPRLTPALVNLGNRHYSDGNESEAFALYQLALSYERSFQVLFNSGNVLHDWGWYEDAIPYYLEAVALSPEFADAYFYLAVCLEKAGAQGASDAARPHWLKYIELAPHGEWVSLAKSFTERAPAADAVDDSPTK